LFSQPTKDGAAARPGRHRSEIAEAVEARLRGWGKTALESTRYLVDGR
jgi:hypothetical protein